MRITLICLVVDSSKNEAVLLTQLRAPSVTEFSNDFIDWTLPAVRKYTEFSVLFTE